MATSMILPTAQATAMAPGRPSTPPTSTQMDESMHVPIVYARRWYAGRTPPQKSISNSLETSRASVQQATLGRGARANDLPQ